MTDLIGVGGDGVSLLQAHPEAIEGPLGGAVSDGMVMLHTPDDGPGCAGQGSICVPPRSFWRCRARRHDGAGGHRVCAPEHIGTRHRPRGAPGRPCGRDRCSSPRQLPRSEREPCDCLVRTTVKWAWVPQKASPWATLGSCGVREHGERSSPRLSNRLRAAHEGLAQRTEGLSSGFPRPPRPVPQKASRHAKISTRSRVMTSYGWDTGSTR